MNYIACIPKNWPSSFDLRLLRSWFIRWSPLFWMFLRLGCEIMDLCFVHSNESTQKFIWITLKHLQYSFEIVTRSRLWFTVSKRGIHLADSFFKPNCSCKIEVTVPCDMPVASTSLRTFTRRSIKTIPWTLSMISGVAASIERPERGTSHVDVRPFLNSFTQCCIQS